MPQHWLRSLMVVALLLLGAAPGPLMAQDAPAATPGGIAPATTPGTTAAQGGVGPSGLPLPRFASLAAPEVNVRTGPSTDHPIRWVYSREGLPVKIVEEFDVWRRIEDPDGETGWAHSSLLSVKRTVLLRGTGIHELRRSPDPNARVVLRAETGVLGALRQCEASWCLVEINGQEGWLPADVLWGVPDGGS